MSHTAHNRAPGSVIITHLIVGTAKGSKLSNSLRSMGTEMRPGQSLKGISYGESQRLSPWSHLSRFVVTCFWMDTEGALQQVVHPFTDIYIKPRVTVLQHDFLLKVLALLAGALQDKRSTHVIICACVYNITRNAAV